MSFKTNLALFKTAAIFIISYLKPGKVYSYITARLFASAVQVLITTRPGVDRDKPKEWYWVTT